MLVKGFDNKEYKLKLSTKQRTNCSKGHIRARILLKKIFPNDIVYEEVTLLGSKRANKNILYCDFLIPSHDILVEVHGKQHYEIGYFHDSKLSFIKAKSNDLRKIEWCELNNISYIELPDGESDAEWELRIFNRYESEEV